MKASRFPAAVVLGLIFFLPVCSGQAAPGRIVSVNVCTDELLPYLTAPEKIAGLTVYSKKNENLEHAARIRGEAEEVLALEPDLVVAGTFTNREMIFMLKRLGVEVLVLDVARDFEAIYRNLRLLGAAVGDEARAQALAAEMQAFLAPQMPDRETRPTAVFYQRAGNVPGADTFENAVLEAAGLQNAAALKGISGHAFMPLETLIEAQPDFLILTDAAAGYDSIGHELLRHPALKKGLVHTRLISLPGDLLECGSPHTVEAVRLLRRAVKGQT